MHHCARKVTLAFLSSGICGCCAWQIAQENGARRGIFAASLIILGLSDNAKCAFIDLDFVCVHKSKTVSLLHVQNMLQRNDGTSLNIT